MIKFRYTILYVNDVEKSVIFYETVFGFVRKFITAENDYGEVDTGETIISFTSKILANTNLSSGFIESNLNQKPLGIELGIVTNEVEILVEKAIQHGAVLVEIPKQKPWGQVVAYVRDLDGFLIEICTPIS